MGLKMKNQRLFLKEPQWSQLASLAGLQDYGLPSALHWIEIFWMYTIRLAKPQDTSHYCWYHFGLVECLEPIQWAFLFKIIEM